MCAFFFLLYTYEMNTCMSSWNCSMRKYCNIIRDTLQAARYMCINNKIMLTDIASTVLSNGKVYCYQAVYIPISTQINCFCTFNFKENSCMDLGLVIWNLIKRMYILAPLVKWERIKVLEGSAFIYFTTLQTAKQRLYYIPCIS